MTVLHLPGVCCCVAVVTGSQVYRGGGGLNSEGQLLGRSSTNMLLDQLEGGRGLSASNNRADMPFTTTYLRSDIIGAVPFFTGR
jgi:hypothetical protein